MRLNWATAHHYHCSETSNAFEVLLKKLITSCHSNSNKQRNKLNSHNSCCRKVAKTNFALIAHFARAYNNSNKIHQLERSVEKENIDCKSGNICKFGTPSHSTASIQPMESVPMPKRMQQSWFQMMKCSARKAIQYPESGETYVKLNLCEQNGLWSSICWSNASASVSVTIFLSKAKTKSIRK